LGGIPSNPPVVRHRALLDLPVPNASQRCPKGWQYTSPGQTNASSTSVCAALGFRMPKIPAERSASSYHGGLPRPECSRRIAASAKMPRAWRGRSSAAVVFHPGTRGGGNARLDSHCLAPGWYIATPSGSSVGFTKMCRTTRASFKEMRRNTQLWPKAIITDV